MNGKKVNDILGNDKIISLNGYGYKKEELQIEDIVTHEQFNSIKYVFES